MPVHSLKTKVFFVSVLCPLRRRGGQRADSDGQYSYPEQVYPRRGEGTSGPWYCAFRRPIHISKRLIAGFVSLTVAFSYFKECVTQQQHTGTHTCTIFTGVPRRWRHINLIWTRKSTGAPGTRIAKSIKEIVYRWVARVLEPMDFSFIDALPKIASGKVKSFAADRGRTNGKGE